MRKLPVLLLALLATVPAASSSPVANAIQGVYRVQHKIAMYDGSLPPGQLHTVEDVMEIVALPHGDAYLRLRTTFDNGHICGVHGISRVEGDALVYRPHDNIEGKCALTLQRNGDRLVFRDQDSVCKYDFCGMRGRFDGEGFPLSSRRPIRYMPRLVASREYAEAMAEQGMDAPPPNVTVRIEPMHFEGAAARYPRLTAFPDNAIRTKFNALMAKSEAHFREFRDECVASLRPADAKSFRVDMRVTYVTPRYISMTFSANRDCAGALASFIASPQTFDLSTPDDLNWQYVFKPGYLYGPRGGQDDGRLAALYRERHTSRGAECRKSSSS